MTENKSSEISSAPASAAAQRILETPDFGDESRRDDVGSDALRHACDRFIDRVIALLVAIAKEIPLPPVADH